MRILKLRFKNDKILYTFKGDFKKSSDFPLMPTPDHFISTRGDGTQSFGHYFPPLFAGEDAGVYRNGIRIGEFSDLVVIGELEVSNESILTIKGE